MLIKKPSDIKSSEITPEAVYRNRREFIKDGTKLIAGSMGIGGSLTSIAQDGDTLKARAPAAMRRSPPANWWAAKFNNIKPAPDSEPFFTGESLTPYEDVTK